MCTIHLSLLIILSQAMDLEEIVEHVMNQVGLRRPREWSIVLIELTSGYISPSTCSHNVFGG